MFYLPICFIYFYNLCDLKFVFCHYSVKHTVFYNLLFCSKGDEKEMSIPSPNTPEAPMHGLLTPNVCLYLIL